MTRILVLGAGLVPRPLVHYLTDLDGYEVTVASRTLSKAEALVEGRNRGRAVELNVRDEKALSALIADHDVTVSLVPATEHVRVARLCLEQGKHMTTTSYISPEMRDLDEQARNAGLTVLNECGVDPGIDHMSAMRVIDSVKARGGRVASFRSYCGGLPAPEANTNPLGYKFSWAPRGVLVAAMAPARFVREGQIVDVPGDELFAAPEPVEVPGAGAFEGYPNRDCLAYIDTYGLQNVETMFRGTLRNVGHCETWYPWAQLGLFDPGPRTDLAGKSYADFMRGFGDGQGDAKAALARRLNLPEDAPALTRLEWLGMFEDQPIPRGVAGNVDVMAARMAERCPYANGERDMIALQHEFVAEYPDRSETIHSTLVDFGIPGGDTSMARTVSLPVAIATRMIADGSLAQRGVIAPVSPEVYNPILDELARLGIVCEERVV